MTATQSTAHDKFRMFRNKLEKFVQEQDYVSHSEDSEDELDEAVNVNAENKHKEEGFYKRSTKLQK